MSYTFEELKGVDAMMPPFNTPDAHDIRAKNTVDVDNLAEGVDRLVKDGVQVISTASGSGEGWNMLWEEFKTQTRTTLEAVDKRAAVFIGVTSANPRETVQKMEFVREAGGEGVLIGLPYYHALSIPNVIAYYGTLADMFPDLSISLYHNPVEFKVHIPVSAYEEFVKHPNIVAQKDSHRTPLEFMKLQDVIQGKIAHFVNATQLYPYYEMGASGCWSFDIFMGPWPVLRGYQAVVDGDTETAKRIMKEISGRGGSGRSGARDPLLAEGGSGRTPQELAGYIKPGPARPPHFEAHGGDERAQAWADRWLKLCEKYRPEVEAWRAAHEAPSAVRS